MYDLLRQTVLEDTRVTPGVLECLIYPLRNSEDRIIEIPVASFITESSSGGRSKQVTLDDVKLKFKKQISMQNVTAGSNISVDPYDHEIINLVRHARKSRPSLINTDEYTPGPFSEIATSPTWLKRTFSYLQSVDDQEFAQYMSNRGWLYRPLFLFDFTVMGISTSNTTTVFPTVYFSPNAIHNTTRYPETIQIQFEKNSEGDEPDFDDDRAWR